MQISKSISKDFTNWLILSTLFVQIILIGILIKKISNIEILLYGPTQAIIDRIPDEQGHSLGPNNAAVTVVEFADFQCPYCARAELIIKRLLIQYPDKIRFIYRHFPLTLHPYAIKAAMVSECGDEQGKFWEIHDLLFTKQQRFPQNNSDGDEFFFGLADEIGINNIDFRNCYHTMKFDEVITRDISDGLKYRVSGTPTFFVNRQKVVGVSLLETTIIKSFEDVSE